MDVSTRATDADGLTVRLLGGFQVAVGGRPVADDAWRLRQARALVKLLALAPDRRLHRERVLDALWPDLDPATAGRRLEQALHAARRALEPGGGRRSRYLPLAREVLTLGAPGAVWVDVEAFEAAAVTAEAGREAAGYEAALALYAGDLLPEDAYEDWTIGRREALRQAHLGLLVGLAGLQEEAVEVSAAIDLLRRAVALEPAHEAAQRALMRLYAATGRRHEALRQYRQLVEALGRELEAEPEPASRRLYAAIQAGQVEVLPDARRSSAPAEAHPDPPTNLPAPLTSFVGRARELAEVRRRLGATRLLTLTGAGGVGKTRLALALAGAVQADYPDGVRLVELAALADPALVPQAVAAALGVAEQPGRPLVDCLTAWLAPRRLLLALDNCEHLRDACAALADALLRAVPGLRLLVTSRAALGVAGEAVWRTPPLAAPDAAALFVARAGEARADAPPPAATDARVAAICRRLDGLPLAIELAAARVRALAVDEIAARLDDRFQLLTGDSRAGLPRHRTLRAAIDWSHDLLTESERALLRRLAVFAGGWTLAAAEAVGAGDGTAAADVLASLLRLVDQSLVQADTGGEAARYGLLETVRQYAAERLVEAGEEAATRDRHRNWCLALAEAAEPELLGDDGMRWLARLDAEHDNLRAALAWCAEHDPPAGLRLAGRLWYFWRLCQFLTEGHRWLAALLARAPAPTANRAQAMLGAALLARIRGDLDRAVAWGEEGLALSRALGDARLIGEWLAELGAAHHVRGAYPAAVPLLAEGLALSRAAGHRRALGTAAFHLGRIAQEQGDYARARALMEECLAQGPAVGELTQSGLALLHLGLVALAQGDADRAAALEEQSLAQARRLGAPGGVAGALGALGRIAAWRGDLDEAARRLEESLAISRTFDHALGIAGPLAQLGLVAIRRGDAARSRAWLEESLAHYRAMGSRYGTAVALHGLGLVAWREGDAARATGHLRASLALRRELGERLGIAECLEGLAAVAAGTGEPTRAARLLGAAGALREAIGAPLPPVDRPVQEAAVAAARAALDEADFARAWAAGAAAWSEGQAMMLDQAVAEALAEGPEPAGEATSSPSAVDDRAPARTQSRC